MTPTVAIEDIMQQRAMSTVRPPSVVVVVVVPPDDVIRVPRHPFNFTMNRNWFIWRNLRAKLIFFSASNSKQKRV